jgi:CheY-like chemotaxis protein
MSQFATDTKGPLVLIAEDREGIKGELVRQLRSKGYRTLVASDGDQALYMMRSYGKMVSAIVTDFNMSDDGTRNADRLLRGMQQENIPMRPTVLFTAEPGNALASMYDVLGINNRSEYTDTPEPTAEQRQVVSGDIVDLKKQRFSNDKNGLTLHVVPKSIELVQAVSGSGGVISQLEDMGVVVPPGIAAGAARRR